SLVDLGHNVTVIASIIKSRKVKKRAFNFESKYSLVQYGSYLPFSIRSGLNFLLGYLVFRREYSLRKFDVVNCHRVSYAGLIMRFAKKRLNFPLVMTPHGEDIQRIPEINYGLRLKKGWEKRIGKNLLIADAVTAISDSIKQEMDFLSQQKIFAIPNGINLDEFVPQKSFKLHDDLRLDYRTKIILSIGRNHVKKGYIYGIKAFKYLIEKYRITDLVYVIVGRDVENLSYLLSKLGLQNRVFLVPQKDRPTILKYYQSAWCFFSPSIVEGLSMVSIEAMATGLPLVVTDVPGNLDIVRDNKCGIIVKNKDPESMARGILDLYLNKELYNKFAEIAVKQVKNYEWSNIAKKYLDVYQFAIERCNSRK
ncbi:MAG TPA: glycosyltransferase family 1 protein, partial [Candidatus Atribacteria bacterium]|nr:glycosyltransferase family 1 protein [Candidatus Atribacteria bacterium]